MYVLTVPTTVYLHPKEDLQVVGATLSDPEQDFSLAIDVLNLSEDTVESVEFDVVFFDAFEKALYNAEEFSFQGNRPIPGKSLYYFPPFPLDERFLAARRVSVRVKGLTYADGREVHYEPLEEVGYPLPLLTLEREELLRKTFGEDVITYGENMISAWRCVCGATNDRLSTTCRHCERNKGYVLSHLTEPIMSARLLQDEHSSISLDFTRTQMTKVPETTEILEKRSRRGQEEKVMISWKRLCLFFILGLFLLSIIGLGVFFISGLQSNHLSLEQVRQLLKTGHYEEAKQTLEEIHGATEDKEYQSLLKSTEALIASSENYDFGVAQREQGNLLSALRHFQKVLPEDGRHYRDAQDAIAHLEQDILGQAREKIRSADPSGAEELLRQYMAIVPESAEATTLFESLHSMTIPKESAAPGADSGRTRSDMNTLASRLLHTYRLVTREDANLRREPSMEGKILLTLDEGDELYVYETKIEGTARVWCHVDVATEDGKISGWISSNVLDEPSVSDN